MKEVKTTLDLDEMPKRWYNILADLPNPPEPPINPATKEPAKPEDLAAIFPMGLIKQEASTERYIKIPEEIREALFHLGRPTPLYRARRLERYLNTPAKIYYKREDMTLTGSHKPNTAIAQAYYNRKEGVEKLATETGAGQWGTALTLAGALLDMAVQVFMVGISFRQKPQRKTIMEMYGGKVVSSPSNLTEYGKKVLKDDPDHPGSLGIAISEAIEMAVKSGGSIKYSLGSVLNHVLLHQTIIGQETMLQLEKLDLDPDIMIGCVGGGSNFAGFAYPALGQKLRGENGNIEFIGVEPEGCPTLTKGKYKYDFGDTAGTTPLLKMYTLGHDFVPSPIHAGGLRYHGDAPSLSQLVNEGYIKAESYDQLKTFEAGKIFSRTEGIVPAPESTHAIHSAIAHALESKNTKEENTIIFNLSGHGLLDLGGYRDFLDGKLKKA